MADEPDSNAAKGAVKKAEALKLPRAMAPDEGEPLWPGNLADLGEEDLGEQLTYWSAMTAYAGEQLALADIERTAFERQRSMCWTKAFLKADDGTVTEKKAIADSDEQVLKALQSFSRHDAEYKLLKAIHAGYEAKYKAASRELSRRQASWDQQRGT